MDILPKPEYTKPDNFMTQQPPQTLMKTNNSCLSTLEPPFSTIQANDDIDSKSSESSFITGIS